MFSTVSSWFVGIKPDDDGTEAIDSTGATVSVQSGEPSAADAKSSEQGVQQTEELETGKDLQQQLDEVSAKAVNTAKEWGSYLYNYGKVASVQVAKAAVQFKDAVTEGTLLGDFSKEQEKFSTEKKQQQKQADAAIAPWVGYNEEETMKKQILALSLEKRNFLRNPPAGVQFSFDYNAAYPVAKAVLQEDDNLQKMRFELVPKQVTEEHFWRNYFYRVSLIKQSAQLSSLAQQTGDSIESRTDNQQKRSREVNIPQLAAATAGDIDREAEQLSPPIEHEFVSDMMGETELSTEEMQQLRMPHDKSPSVGASHPLSTPSSSQPKPQPKLDDDWEEELQHELQEYEVVMQGQDGVSDLDLESELLRQMEEEQDELQAAVDGAKPAAH